MTNRRVQPSSRASVKKGSGRSVSTAPTKTTAHSCKRVKASERGETAGIKKETTPKLPEHVRKVLNKKQKGQVKHQLPHARIARPAKRPQKHIPMPRKISSNTPKSTKKKEVKEEDVETTGAHGDGSKAKSPRARSKAPGRLNRRNAIVNAEKASKEAQAAAARVRAAQQKSRRVNKGVSKVAGKQSRADTKRMTKKQRRPG